MRDLKNDGAQFLLSTSRPVVEDDAKDDVFGGGGVFRMDALVAGSCRVTH